MSSKFGVKKRKFNDEKNDKFKKKVHENSMPKETPQNNDETRKKIVKKAVVPPAEEKPAQISNKKMKLKKKKQEDGAANGKGDSEAERPNKKMKVEKEAEHNDEDEDMGEGEISGGHKNVPDNIMLFNYYKGILQNESEFEKIKQALHIRLQTTFRIGGDQVIADAFLRKMKTSPSFQELEKGVAVANDKIPPPSPISWYPDDKAWKYSVSGEFIRKSETFSQFHNFLVSASNSGDIWRQEEASMIPPCFLDANPDHKILDMCAAPGSKTGQIHDMIFGKRTKNGPASGCIVANDASQKRCLLLAQRLSKINSPHILITNHEAQKFPLKSGGMKLSFDRILCDVPCSGDGTLRKQPSKVWEAWSVSSAFSLHALQSAIVQRGLELLGLNGKLVYSTCSMNPIENEAVVSTILQKFKGQVELVDVSKQVPGLKRSKGMNEWRVMDENGNWYSKFAEVPKEQHSTILPTMFPAKNKPDLSRCVRIYPHTQDTSGFFVAVFKVIKLIEPEIVATDNSTPNKTKNKKHTPPPRYVLLQGEGKDKINTELMTAITNSYQLKDNFPWNLCFARKEEVVANKVKKVVLFSESLSNILLHNKKDVITVINGGVTLFERTTKDFTRHNNFKPTSESLTHISAFLGAKRTFTFTNASDLQTLITQQRLAYTDMQDAILHNAVRKLFAGYVIIRFSLGGSGEPQGMVICRNGNGSLSLCATSTQVWSLKFLLNYH